MPAIGSMVNAICYDSECGTVLKMGSPPFVQSYANSIREKYLASHDPIIAELADTIRVVPGPFSEEEYERIRDCSSYILRSHALRDPRLSRSEERRVGNGCVSTCQSRGSPYP